MNNIYNDLRSNNLINEDQYTHMEAIRTNKIVSLYYELRLLLYLGIMLFTGGIGYVAWQNMGALIHLLTMTLLGAGSVICFIFIRRFSKPYSNSEVETSHVYFDYLSVLTSLLVISLLTYVQVYFNLTEMFIHQTSYISAGLLMYMAYRYDNKAQLSMGITAIAAAVGLSITPIDWVSGEWHTTANLYITGILFGILLVVAGHITYRKAIKQHFLFTYRNFGLIFYFTGGIAAIFVSESQLLYATLMLLSAIAISLYTWKSKDFLFFLYSNIAGYIAFTYLLWEWLDNSSNDLVILLYYFPITCIGYILFLIQKKSHFAHD